MPLENLTGNAKASHAHISPGSEEGDNSLPGQQHEPRDLGLAETNPLGDRARRPNAVAEDRADPGRIPKPSKGLLLLPHYQGLADPGMARTTFVAAAKAYLDAMRPYYQTSTLEWWRRNLITIRKDLKALIAAEREGLSNVAKNLRKEKPLTDTPSQIGEREIGALLLRWKERLDVS